MLDLDREYDTPDGRPRCTAVFITWNRRKELEVALDAVFAQSMADAIEVVVVDNGSTDGTVDWLAREYPHPVRILAYPHNMGACHARNAGILAARSDRIAFIDSDAIVLTHDGFERALAQLDKVPDRAAVSARIWWDRECTRPFLLGGYFVNTGHFDPIDSMRRTDDPMFPSTCFAVWRKSALESLGGFDPWYFWKIEDAALGLKAYHRAKRLHPDQPGPFAVAEDVDVHHDMSLGGRTIPPDDFEGTFSIVERQRLYLVLSHSGVGEFLRAIARGLANPGLLDHVYQRRVPRLHKLRGLVFWPMVRLFLLPFNLLQVHRNHLASTPRPREVARRAS